MDPASEHVLDFKTVMTTANVISKLTTTKKGKYVLSAQEWGGSICGRSRRRRRRSRRRRRRPTVLKCKSCSNAGYAGIIFKRVEFLQQR